VSVSAAVFDLAAQLVDPETRIEAANRLARECGAESLILFVRDQSGTELLPLPGFPDIDVSDCHSVVNEAIRNGRHAGDDAYAISRSPDFVLLLVGLMAPNGVVSELECALPLLELALCGQLKADQESQAKTEFLAIMGHELRTPLNAIGGYVQLLQLGVHGPLTPPQNDALERVHRSQQHLLRLINDILSLARIEAGGMKYDIVNVDLSEAVRETFPAFAPQAAEAKLALTLELADVEIGARADREKLEQILAHLVSNATKFTPAGGRITIATGLESDDYAFVEVRDTGVGIPADKREAIFDAFVQVRAGLNRTHEGSGLGLAISRDLARGMNGDITVESVEGKGSAFRLHLPRAARLRSEGRRTRTSLETR
jgi:signal transduction histidine kinase